MAKKINKKRLRNISGGIKRSNSNKTESNKNKKGLYSPTSDKNLLL